MASTQTHDHELIEQAYGILREAGIPVENQKSDQSFQPIPIEQLHRVIDHTLLKAEATEDQIIALCSEAKDHHFASVCVNPCFIPTAAQQLKGSDVAVCTVIGFPLGSTLTSVKVYEAETAISAGAAEVDMVINVGWLKSKKYKEILHEIRQIVAVSRDKAIVKVIIETALLSDLEKVIACLLSRIAGADFVKTSTGFSTGGATESDIRLMRLVVGPEMGVKASGGVRLRSDAETMLQAGATRIGASASVAIVKGDGTTTAGY